MEAFLKQKNFVSVIQNGQRIIGCKSDMHEVHNEIYLSKLPKSFKEEQLLTLLTPFHDLKTIRTIINFNNECRGYCYIDFYSLKSALLAQQIFDNMLLDISHVISCKMSSEDKLKLFISFQWREVKVLDMLNYMVNMIDIKEIKFINLYDPDNRGCAYCMFRFRNHSAAAKARKIFLNNVASYPTYVAINWMEKCKFDFNTELLMKIEINEELDVTFCSQKGAYYINFAKVL